METDFILWALHVLSKGWTAPVVFISDLTEYKSFVQVSGPRRRSHSPDYPVQVHTSSSSPRSSLLERQAPQHQSTRLHASRLCGSAWQTASPLLWLTRQWSLSPSRTLVISLTSDGKENAKLTGDRVKMLMLTLPFMVCDLIAEQLEFNQLFELTTFNLQREQWTYSKIPWTICYNEVEWTGYWIGIQNYTVQYNYTRCCCHSCFVDNSKMVTTWILYIESTIL